MKFHSIALWMLISSPSSVGAFLPNFSRVKGGSKPSLYMADVNPADVPTARGGLQGTRSSARAKIREQLQREIEEAEAERAKVLKEIEEAESRRLSLEQEAASVLSQVESRRKRLETIDTQPSGFPGLEALPEAAAPVGLGGLGALILGRAALSQREKVLEEKRRQEEEERIKAQQAQAAANKGGLSLAAVCQFRRNIQWHFCFLVSALS